MPRSFDSVFYGAAGTSTGGPPDDEFNRVSFLSHFDGANNGVNNAFDDGSTSNHTITANGNVTQGSFGPFARTDGNWGWSFDGSGDYLSVPDSDDFNIGSGLFTAETWIFPTGSPSQAIIMGQWSGSYSWVFLFSSGSARYPRFIIYDGAFHDKISSTAVPLNQWSHLALVRETSNVFKMYLNGDEIYSVTLNKTAVNSTDPLTIGADTDGNSAIQGFLSNTRFVKGTAVYTSAFTPSTSPLTAVTNTKLLTCQSNRFVDNSASGHAITPAGNPAVTAFGPFLTSAVYSAGTNGASGYFDGTGDSLSTASSADFALGTGDFTVAFWVYQKEVKDYTIYYDYRSTSNQNTLYLYQQANGVFDLSINNTSHFFTPPSMLNRWAYIAISRASSTTKLFVDGVQYLSFSDSTNYVQGTTFYVGRFWQSDTYNFNGYMCDFRFVKGTAVYTSAFTPPTAPLTAITNTKLLLNMADGQAIDSAAQNNLTLYGNAKISTGQAKFGDTSLLLDGTGDAAQIATTTNSFAFGTGDYTVEMWLYLTAVNENDQIFDMRTADSSVNPGSYLDSSARPNLYISGGVRLTSNTAISANTWTHFAICRASGTTRIFQAGQVTGTLNSDTYNIVAGKLMLGARYNSAGTNNGQGHWEDVRVSNMARYTSNFTAPSEPFADKGQ